MSKFDLLDLNRKRRKSLTTIAPPSLAAVDWDHSITLTESQIDIFLKLEEDAVNSFHVFGFHPSTSESSDEQDTQLDLMDYSFSDQINSLSKSKLVHDSLNVSNPLSLHLNALEFNVHAVKNFKNHLTATASLVDHLENLTDQLQSADNVIQKSTNRVIREKGEIDRIANEIETHLDHFAFLDEFAAWVAQSPLPLEDVESARAILSRADECLSFMSGNAQFTDTVLYGTRFRSCMTRAIIGIRNHVVNTLQDKGASIASTAIYSIDQDAIEYEQVSPNDAALAIMATARTSLYAKDLLVLCEELSPIVSELNARCTHHQEYHTLRKECVHAYLTIKWQAIGPVIDQLITCVKRMDSLLVDRVSSSVSNITGLVNEEISIFCSLFGNEYIGDIQPLFENMYRPFYAHLRPKITGESNLQTLAQVCNALIPSSSLNPVLCRIPILATLLVDAQHRLVFRSQETLNTVFSQHHDPAYTPEIRQAVYTALHCLSGSVGSGVVQALATEWVPLLLDRILDLAEPFPPSELLDMRAAILPNPQSAPNSPDHPGETSGLLKSPSRTPEPVKNLDPLLIEIQLFRIHELATVLEAVRQVPALTNLSPSHEIYGAYVEDLLVTARNVQTLSTGSLFELVLGLPSSSSKPGLVSVAPKSNDSADHIQNVNQEPESIVQLVENTLVKARNDFLLDCVHSCTYQLKRWLVRSASTEIIDPKHMKWASLDSVFQLARDWHACAETEIKITLGHIRVYLGSHASAQTLVLRPLVDGIAAIYGNFIGQVVRVHGDLVMNGFMSLEDCVHWLNQSVCL